MFTLNANVDPFIFCNFDWNLVYIRECEFPVTLLESLRAPSNLWTCHLKPAKIKLCKILQTDICIMGDTNWRSTIQASTKNFTILQTMSSFVFKKKLANILNLRVFSGSAGPSNVWKVDNAMHWINLCPVYGAISFVWPPAKMASWTMKRSIGQEPAPVVVHVTNWENCGAIVGRSCEGVTVAGEIHSRANRICCDLWIIGARKQMKLSIKQG